MQYEIRDLHPSTGSEVVGLDLSQPVDAETRAHLNKTLADRGVLIFRNQKFEPSSFADAARNFGDLMDQQVKKFCLPEYPIVGFISNRDLQGGTGKVSVRGENFHTDHSNFREPPKATALFAVSLPATGGDTQFVNAQAAYDELPAEMKARIEGLRSRHVYQSSRSPRPMAPLSPEELKAVPETKQPIVVTNPDNGRKGLYLNTGRMEGIEGLSDSDAYALIDALMEHAVQSKYEYRHKWRDGDMVIWDNRSVMHKANADVPPDQYRYLYRLMVKGQSLN